MAKSKPSNTVPKDETPEELKENTVAKAPQTQILDDDSDLVIQVAYIAKTPLSEAFIKARLSKVTYSATENADGTIVISTTEAEVLRSAIKDFKNNSFTMDQVSTYLAASGLLLVTEKKLHDMMEATRKELEERIEELESELEGVDGEGKERKKRRTNRSASEKAAEVEEKNRRMRAKSLLGLPSRGRLSQEQMDKLAAKIAELEKEDAETTAINKEIEKGDQDKK